MKTTWLLLAPATLLIACGPTPPARAPAPEAGGAESDVVVPVEPLSADEAARRIDDIADAYVAAYFRRHPESATIEGVEGADHGALDDNSLNAVAAWRGAQRELLADLAAVDTSALEPGSRGRVTYHFLREVLESHLGREVCRMELWNVSPTWTGWQAEKAFLATIQPVGTPELRDAALARFGALDAWIETEIQNLREGLGRGYSEPRTNVRAVIEQMDGLLVDDPTASPFYAPALRDTTPAFRQAMASLVANEINPAVRRYRDFLQQEYLPRAREEIGVSAHPDGARCYAAAVRYHTSLRLPAERIHEIGLAQMEMIREEMAEIARSEFGTEDVAEALRRVRAQPEYRFRSRQHMLDYARDALQRAKLEVPDWFGILPKADVVVEPYPAFQEKSAPGGEYMGPSDDLSRPGVYRINLYEADRQSIAGLEATAFHETYPGHHLQIAIAKERTDTHPVQKYFGTSGFIEGWALYAERLAEEMGIYSGEVDLLGLLSNEALRAARLVVDPGMHMLGWSRQQAVDYILAHTAESPARAAAEVDRYIAVPGQATAYMLGSLEIRRLRDLAERELGEDFDVRDFHDLVLEDGAVTLRMLEGKVGRWAR